MHDPQLSQGQPVEPSPPVPTDPVASPYAPTSVEPVQRRQSRGSGILLTVAAIVAIGGIAFAAGRLTAPAAAAVGSGDGLGLRNGAPFGSFVPGNGQFPGGAGGQFRAIGRSVTLRGEVTAISSDSVTVKIDSGSEVTVPLDAQTTYHQATAGSASDVTVGSTVVVEPGTTDFNPGASPAPGASFEPGNALSFGPATDVTVVQP